MKILHLNTFDNRGGAARAAYRIHTALIQAGVSSIMMVGEKNSNDNSVIPYTVPFKEKKISFAKKILSLDRNLNHVYRSCNIFPSGIHKIINELDIDIVNLHWIGHELISIPEIRKIKKNIVWTLHDMWPFSGSEHYNLNKKNKISVDNFIFKIKKIYWRKIEFHFISPSKWLSDSLYNSSIFHRKKCKIIPNCLDTDIFKPMEREKARNFFNIPLNKKIILFGASGGKNSYRKGYLYLKEAVEKISKDRKDIECVVFGGKKDGIENINNIVIRNIGKVYDDNELSLLYSAADVFVTPSVIDNLPNTIMEAMSCGTPCVGFAVGGITEMIDHEINGVLSEPFDTNSLSQGIDWIISNNERQSQLGEEARKKVINNYCRTIIAEQYKKYYIDIK